ncbi:exonuclease SbcCD subunit D [Pleomorphomonas sp. PLEO]|uniref:metallophosphoesterase family protein n=1 Tax=Pleomorphomonas sp. PLEO TaxID=3239306 RepID=UPI00351F7887
MKLIHTADWQLGKPFARFDPEVRAALTEARFDSIDAIGKAASENGAAHVLVAGDIFDTDGPSDRTIVQALSRMQRQPCRWWLLPGNHDYTRSGGLWDRVRAKGTSNITVVDQALPVEIESGTWLLPAPLVHRHNLEDPTTLFDTMATPNAVLRIGLAHGSIRGFGSQGETANQISPDRARTSSLDYLALGDWHGTLKIDDRTWYSGTPEADRFQRDEPGQALCVNLEPGLPPQVTPVRTGKFQWMIRDWRVDDLASFSAQSRQLLNAVEPAGTLLQLTLTGIAALSDRIAILLSLEHEIAHQLRYLDVRADALVAPPNDDDIAALAIEGMLGDAARKLNALIEEGGANSATAKRALERLFVEVGRGETA